MPKIAVLPGDGIGPEVIAPAVKILKALTDFTFEEGLVGAAAIVTTQNSLPDETLQLCLNSDAVLFGAVGDPKFDHLRPEKALLAIRKALNAYANIRPIFHFSDSNCDSPLKDEVRKDVDFIIVRELTGGAYFGKKGRSDNRFSAFDTCEYSVSEIERVSSVAFELAKSRKKKVTLVDKANVMETSRLWRETVTEMAKNHPEITFDTLYVDNAAMQIIQNPRQFDIMLTENMFGDILSDEAAMITGSMGLLPSASIGGKIGFYEPIHGSYPQGAGLNIANPIAAILSAALMLEYSFKMHEESERMWIAVKKTLAQGFGTPDLKPTTVLTTEELGEKILSNL